MSTLRPATVYNLYMYIRCRVHIHVPIMLGLVTINDERHSLTKNVYRQFVRLIERSNFIEEDNKNINLF